MQAGVVVNAALRARLSSLGIRSVTLNPIAPIGEMDGGHTMYSALPAQFENQGVLQQESRKFTTLSNASQQRHDAAKNAIQNMKG
jgi:hypothetical protein